MSFQAKEQEFEEELEDLPEAEKQADPLNGAHISRVLGGETYTGKVEDIEVGKISKERLYRVRYCDNDLEHYTAAQVQEFRYYPPEAAGANAVARKPAAADPEDDEMDTPSGAAVKRPAATAELEGEPAAKRPAVASAEAMEEDEEEAEAEEEAEPESAAMKKPGAALAAPVLKKPGAAEEEDEEAAD